MSYFAYKMPCLNGIFIYHRTASQCWFCFVWSPHPTTCVCMCGVCVPHFARHIKCTTYIVSIYLFFHFTQLFCYYYCCCFWGYISIPTNCIPRKCWWFSNSYDRPDNEEDSGKKISLNTIKNEIDLNGKSIEAGHFEHVSIAAHFYKCQFNCNL